RLDTCESPGCGRGDSLGTEYGSPLAAESRSRWHATIPERESATESARDGCYCTVTPTRTTEVLSNRADLARSVNTNESSPVNWRAGRWITPVRPRAMTTPWLGGAIMSNCSIEAVEVLTQSEQAIPPRRVIVASASTPAARATGSARHPMGGASSDDAAPISTTEAAATAKAPNMRGRRRIAFARN